MTVLCDYCHRYPVRFTARNDDELREVCGRHLAVVVQLLDDDTLGEQDEHRGWVTVAPSPLTAGVFGLEACQ